MTDHRLVFVGGLHRSGTTPLARCLAAHRQISGFANTGAEEDEGQHLQTVYPPARAYGGPGRFARHPAAHLTESSPLLTPDTAARLLDQWRPHWDLARPVLVEKSPPNLLMTRFLQGAFPDARFVMVVRHPAIVSLSTRKWARLSSLGALLDHWFAAHRRFEDDAPFIHRLLVVKYEHLVADPERTLAEIAAFLELDGDIPTGGIDTRRSATYERQWADLAAAGPWRRERFRGLCRRHEAAANHFGYSLLDLERADPFPVGSPRTP
ncbi:MAG TPA: sulfotransferase [Actinomycetota bacterium]|nr:sulfotransferase [Actinomycetota bacterium]